ncbi:hypothetical protein [Candidatus Mycolicibacterium alkanivorans]|uniref:Ammonium transporter AmtB-like domain-containing protein n=1 Tax=Candidatus Mycolicibacterium alkanivorans TaxID=2954114 RepID=A0ABS9YU65_9MYCO|nr:hypothetical protein [Candidatus Mycolicibacterium alkanivorans]MCI4673914.1 hypothetical protein [Candidatus Mycolicibacterium alkanivorans]
MNSVSQFAAMGGYTGEMSTASLLMSIVVISLAIAMPALVLAISILKSPGKGLDEEIGLGKVSLHDEMWDFVSAVESGEVTLASIDAGACDSPTRTLGSSPHRSAG